MKHIYQEYKKDIKEFEKESKWGIPYSGVHYTLFLEVDDGDGYETLQYLGSLDSPECPTHDLSYKYNKLFRDAYLNKVKALCDYKGYDKHKVCSVGHYQSPLAWEERKYLDRHYLFPKDTKD